ncbi:MAG: VCBS repeat-containing protein [Daejeonella sp.]
MILIRILFLCAPVLFPFFAFSQQPLFSSVTSAQTGIHFQNKLTESPEHNIITYEYFYNGGGVAAGDFNNDGLIDLFFSSNQQAPKLYLNKGNWKFEDITRKAGVSGKPGWKTGVSIADVNGDGFLDIYLCYSGDVAPEERSNQLFINNKNLTFTDKAEEMGVADKGYSTNAAFFDYDRDGDLDLYVLNHNIKNLRNFDAAFVKKMVDPDAGDRLYENINGIFVDISRKAGIISNPLGYGLGINVSDVNNDGWPDLYISNDYVEEDYLYINNKNRTFTESLKSELGHISSFSMGVDIADINNDGLADIYTMDMLPEDNRRQKLIYAPDNYELYNNSLQNGFYHQLMRNMLQVNNGNGTFSEIGQLSGISNTDWSWAALLADFNNDGKKDLFVSNGYGRDMINRDFMKFYANERLKHLSGKTDNRMYQMLQGIQSTPLHNYIYENTGDFRFKDRSSEWGFSEPDFSHGAAYADLDNDGDLDLVVNRMNAEAGIYRNNTIENKSGGNFLKIKLQTKSLNTFAIGAKVNVFCPSGEYTLENTAVHGFQSSMLGPLNFSFPDNTIDSVLIHWPDGRDEKLGNNTKINQQITVIEKISDLEYHPIVKAKGKVFKTLPQKIKYEHQESTVNDFKLQPLMLSMVSYSGPRIAKADLNKDGLDDIYICGSQNQPGKIFIQQKDGNFAESDQPAFTGASGADECGAVFFDADNDGDKDLYVICGSYNPGQNNSMLQDRLYLNEKGIFNYNPELLPIENMAGSQVLAIDFDNDNDLDLFVAGRVVPGKFPEAAQSFLLVNNGKGKFTNQTSLLAPEFLSLGLLTDAIWTDLRGDGKNILIVCAEWMPLKCFEFKAGKFIETTDQVFGQQLSGLWNRLHLADLDGDGDADLIAGNWGTNSQLHASAKEPLTMFYADFDNNGYIDPIICCYIAGTSYPMASRDEMTDQIVSLRQRFPTYDSYADATITDILNEDQLKSAKKLKVDFLNTVWFENVNGKFEMHLLPVQADFSPVYAINTGDFNHDGNMDMLLAGNTEHVRIKIGKMDANYGTLLCGDGKGNFKYVDQNESGLNIKGSVRDIVSLKTNGAEILMFGVNNGEPIFLSY